MKYHLVSTVAVIALASGIGCTGCSNTAEKPGEHHHHVEHGDVGPHGGMILEWGAHVYHVELVIDRGKEEATAYLLGEDLKKPKPIDAKQITLTLKGHSEPITMTAAPQEGDPDGKSSRYTAKDSALASTDKISGAVTGTAGGESYSGPFDEAKTEKPHDHDHKDHDHDHKDHDHKDHDHDDHDHKDHDHK